MTAKIQDVARLAGVSPRTVSNVVNNFIHVRTETRERVQAAIDTLNYKPNIAARRLRQGQTRTLAYAVPELGQPYFAELVELVEREALALGYTLVATQTGGDIEVERRVLADFNSHIVDGLIFSPMKMTAEDLAATPAEVPMVLIGEQISASVSASFAIDNVAAARSITEHLIAEGHTRIATLGAYQGRDYRSSQLRLQGYREAMEAHGRIVDPDLILYTDIYGRRAGYEGVRRALAAGVSFDAIFCFTDLVAFGAMRALADAGLSVPRDVAIAGIDDLEESEFSVPSLTTVAPDKPAMARDAVSRLVATIADPTLPPVDTQIAQRLIVRESSRRSMT